MSKVCIIGSINMDMIVSVDEMPQVGETIISENFKLAHGGKGANQAVAAKRMCNEVHMISKIGKDAYGYEILESLKNENIDVSKVFQDKCKPTGTAIITVNKDGNNSIVVIPGANMAIDKYEIESCKDIIINSDIVVAQFETTLDATIEAFKIAKENHVITILNPAPANKIPDELLKYTDIIIPNETEAATLTGIEVTNLEDAEKAAKSFLSKGVKYSIITLGEKGAALVSNEKSVIVPAYKVKAVDTTAAGDSFIGALSAKLDKKNVNFDTLIEAVKFGNKVSSIVVQKEGAQPSIPFINDIENI